MITNNPSFNRRIPIEKKIEAVEYALAINNNVKAAEKFNVSEWTIRYWKSNIENLKKASKKKEKITLHKGKPLSKETIETDLHLLEFIKINRKYGIPITTFSVKIELLKFRPDLSKLTPNGLYEYIYRFMSRNNLSLRTPGHIGQLLPTDTKNVIINYIMELRKTIKEGGYDEGNIINMDETPLYLNMIPNKVISQKGEKNVVVRTQNQEKIRVTCLLSICADGDKLPPYIIFKGKNSNNKAFNKLKNNLYIKTNKIFINFNNNAWSTTELMLDWIDKVYLAYIKKDPLCGEGLLIIDKASSHISEEVIEKCTGNLMDLSILPAGTTSIMQPLDISINKKFKNYIREKYINHCIKNNVTFAKVEKEDIINWIGDIWYDDTIISKNIIYNSFKVCGLSNNINGTEDHLIKCFEFLKNKINEISEDDEIYEDNPESKLENEQIKLQEKLYNTDDD